MRKIRNFKITKGLSWYYIFAFVAIFGLAVYLYQSFKIREGATNQQSNGAGSIAWFKMASGGAPFIGKRNADGAVQYGDLIFDNLSVVQDKVEIGNNVKVFGKDTNTKDGKIEIIEDSATGYSGKKFTIKYDDASPNTTSYGHNLILNLAPPSPVQTTKSANTSSPPALPTEGNE